MVFMTLHYIFMKLFLSKATTSMEGEGENAGVQAGAPIISLLPFSKNAF